MHAVDARLGMPDAADPDAVIDGYDVLVWADGSADVLLTAGDRLVCRVEVDAAEAARLAEVLRERGVCTLGEVLFKLQLFQLDSERPQ